MAGKDDKYIVISRERAEGVTVFMPGGNLLGSIEYANKVTEYDFILDDAVVIRTSDVFAVSGLYAYAHTITTHIELLGDLLNFASEEVDKPRIESMMKSLTEIADYFHDRALEAERKRAEGRVKVPD